MATEYTPVVWKILDATREFGIMGNLERNNPRNKVLVLFHKGLTPFIQKDGGGAYREHKILYSVIVNIDEDAGKVTKWNFEKDSHESHAKTCGHYNSICKILNQYC